MSNRTRTADDLIDMAIRELEESRELLHVLIPCSLTIHFPSPRAADVPRLEVNKIRIECGRRGK